MSFLNTYKVYFIVGLAVLMYCTGWYVRGVFYKASQVKELKVVNETLVKSQTATNEATESKEIKDIEITKQTIKHAEDLRIEDGKNPNNCTYSPERVRIVNEAFGTK